MGGGGRERDVAWMCAVFCLLKQISPFQTSTDKIIRHSEHNSVLYSATKDLCLVSLHLVSQGCDASIIILSKRARLERQERSFHTLTVHMKWPALIQTMPKWREHFQKGHLQIKQGEKENLL